MSPIADTKQPPRERFTKVYPLGMARLESLITLKGGPTVTKVWVFLVKHCGHDNALCCTAEVMAAELGCSKKTILRTTKYLEDNGALVIARAGTANVYILNCDEVWKTYEEHKRFCGFRTRTLLGFKQNASLKTRITHMTERARTGDLFADAAE